MSINYRSTFEHMVHNALGPEWEYEPESLPYWVPRKYTPDFVRGNCVIEAKGYFRDGDMQKYRAIDAQLTEEGRQLIFILMKANQRVRKGTNITMADWCDRNNIPWFDLETIDNFDWEEFEDE